MNKLIKNFNDDLAKKQLRNADSKINYLEESYDQVKKENTNMKNKRGLREALRTEVDKCHRIIDELKHSNQELRRNHQEDGFDGQQKNSRERQEDREGQVREAAWRQAHPSEPGRHQGPPQEDRVFREVTSARETGVDRTGREVVQERETDNDKLAKRNEETKVFYEYELQNLKSKVNELELENEDHREKGKQILAELDMVSEENELKTQSIANLEKIVNELIRKNSLLADHTAGTLENSLKHSAELEFKNKTRQLGEDCGHSAGRKSSAGGQSKSHGTAPQPGRQGK